MDEISRESLPDSPGQRVSDSAQQRKGPTEWIRAAGGGEFDRCDPEGGDTDPIGEFDHAETRGASASIDGARPGEHEDDDPVSRKHDAADGDPDPLPTESSDKVDDNHDGYEPTAETPDAVAEREAEADSEMLLSEALEGVLSEDLDGLPEDLSAVELDEEALSRVLCALLLSSRDTVSMLRLAQTTNTTPTLIRAGLERLKETLATSGLPLEVSIAGEQVRLLTTPDVFGYLRQLRQVKKQEKLSAAALETLAVVAYRQPVMRAEVEAIRGVKAGPILRTLLDHRMITTVGRADVPGRPLQYGTTQHFLETFGLESLKDLPSVKELRSL